MPKVSYFFVVAQNRQKVKGNEKPAAVVSRAAQIDGGTDHYLLI